MKKTMHILTIAALSCVSLSAADFINAVKVTGDLAKVKSDKLKFEDVVVYPQTTIGNADKDATVKMADVKAKKAKVAVVYNDKEMSVVVKWNDETKSIQLPKESNSYGDAYALQFPQSCTDGDKLPYIGMGSDGRPVTIYLQKSVEKFYAPNGGGDVESQLTKQNINAFGDDLAKREKAVADKASTKYTKAFVAEGFRSTTEIKDDAKFDMKMSYGKKEYVGVLTKPLSDGYVASCDALPVAIALWDGGKDGRDGSKWLSSWVSVKFADTPKAKAIIAETGKKVKGDVANGKKLATDNCAACHTMGDIKATPFMAPNLSNIGGQATASYIKESMISPSAVVVPGYNVNAHPANAWYSQEGGKRTSTMPGFDFLKPQEIDDITAYLQTLKKEVK